MLVCAKCILLLCKPISFILCTHLVYFPIFMRVCVLEMHPYVKICLPSHALGGLLLFFRYTHCFLQQQSLKNVSEACFACYMHLWLIDFVKLFERSMFVYFTPFYSEFLNALETHWKRKAKKRR